MLYYALLKIAYSAFFGGYFITVPFFLFRSKSQGISIYWNMCPDLGNCRIFSFMVGFYSSTGYSEHPCPFLVLTTVSVRPSEP